MSDKFKWPLAVSTFTLLDKLSIAKWILTNDRYTMGKETEKLEKEFSELSGMKALAVSSGSTANQLVFEIWKINNPGVKPLVIVPSVTWISSISPAIMAGMDIQFCDVNLNDFCFDYDELKTILALNKDRRVIIWPTALIGFVPNFARLKELAAEYKADLFLDSCENTFSYIDGKSILASSDMTTTSCYFSHQIVSIEMGFVFFKNEADYLLGKMFRNHGLSRSLPANSAERLIIEKENSSVDPQFLFALNGTNLRPTDVHAVFGLKDIKRAEDSTLHRWEIYHSYYESLNTTKYYLPPLTREHVGFCLPIFTKSDNLAAVKAKLIQNGIEVRPIVGGNLLRQPPFKMYGNPELYPNAEWIHNHGCYLGIHKDVTVNKVRELCDLLDSI